jgi:hypothetical protein
MDNQTDPAASFVAPSARHLPGGASNGHGSGGSGLGTAPPSGRPPGPSAKPAAVVFGVILLVFLAGFVADELSSAPHGARRPSPAASTPVPHTGGLVPGPASAVLAPVVTADEPPADIVSALVVPKGTAAVPGSASQQGVGLYDATIDLQVPAPEQDVITFTRTELAAGRWQVLSAGPSGHDYRIVAQHPGSDGYEWEVGLTLSPTTFTSSVPGTTAPAGGITPMTLRLFAIADAS